MMRSSRVSRSLLALVVAASALLAASCTRAEAVKADQLTNDQRAGQIANNDLVPPAQKAAVKAQMDKMQSSHPPEMNGKGK